MDDIGVGIISWDITYLSSYMRVDSDRWSARPIIDRPGNGEHICPYLDNTIQIDMYLIVYTYIFIWSDLSSIIVVYTLVMVNLLS